MFASMSRALRRAPGRQCTRIQSYTTQLHLPGNRERERRARIQYVYDIMRVHVRARVAGAYMNEFIIFVVINILAMCVCVCSWLGEFVSVGDVPRRCETMTLRVQFRVARGCDIFFIMLYSSLYL